MTGTGAILGRGVAFPPHIGSDGRWAWSEGEINIREAIQVIVMTEPGERLQLPDFGGGLGALLFEPNTTATCHAAGERIRAAVSDWEPRVTVSSVDVEPDPADSEAAVATVTYQLVATQATAAVALPIELRG
jgi:phage baseplate assembly protein W